MNVVRKILLYIGLVTVIPAVVGVYLFMTPLSFGTPARKTLIVFTSLLVCLGFLALVKLVRYLSHISASLSLISNGNFSQKIVPPGEIGRDAEFASSINHISMHLRESADELERRALLIELSNQELNRMAKVKMQLLSEVTHELRSPLINIEKVSQLLLEDNAAVDAQHRDFLRMINENASRMMRLVNEFLDMSKLEAGALVLRRESVEVGPLVNEAAAAVARWRQSKGLALKLNITPGLPRVLADRDRIVQIIINLMSNAIKFTPEGGTITVEARLSDFSAVSAGAVEIRVTDTGIGIAPEKQKDIFEKYTTLDPAGVLPGTGLGLPIARQLVELHKGTLSVKSSPGQGSTFSFTIPC